MRHEFPERWFLILGALSVPVVLATCWLAIVTAPSAPTELECTDSASGRKLYWRGPVTSYARTDYFRYVLYWEDRAPWVLEDALCVVTSGPGKASQLAFSYGGGG